MKFCSNCGTQLTDETKFCQNCGKATDAAQSNSSTRDKAQEYQKKVENAVADFVNTKDETAEFDATDIDNNKTISLFSYLGLLIIIPLLAAPQSKYAKFHVNQGLILLIVSFIVGIISGVVTLIVGFISSILAALVGFVFSLISIALFVFMIIGIVNAVQGKAKELPLIGGFRFLK